MSREPIPTWFFALVIVRKGEKFLLVHEKKHGQEWYFPAGRVEPGETLIAAAHRETLEEAGIPILIDGILHIEHTLISGGSRMRVFFIARPKDDTPPKSVPDEESLEAGWFSLDEMESLPLRSSEVKALFHKVYRGATIYPLKLFVT